jgi:Holliday junction resolvasome RuvABC endonuclease subunit
MITKLTIGLDISINCTGIAVMYEQDSIAYQQLYVLSPYIHKHRSIDIEYLQYDKHIDATNYSTKESSKAYNYHRLSNTLCKALFKYFKQLDKACIPKVIIENFAHNAIGAAKIDTPMLNAVVRDKIITCFDKYGTYLFIITPLQNKKRFTGNGKASKEMMVQEFLHKNPEFEYVQGAKLDDVADAFALASSHFIIDTTL